MKNSLKTYLSTSFAFMSLTGCWVSEGPSLLGEQAAKIGRLTAKIELSDNGEFGVVDLNTFNTHTFTVTNSGTVMAVLGVISTQGLGLSRPFSLTGGTCGSGDALQPGQSCTLLVTYRPQRVQLWNGAVNLPYLDGISTRTVVSFVAGDVNPLQGFTWIGAVSPSVAVSGWSGSSSVAVDGSFVDGGFNNVNGLAIDSTNGFFYTVDSATYSGRHADRVCKFVMTSGAFVGCIGKTVSSTGTCPSSGASPGWCTGGIFTTGSADGEFDFVNDIGLDVPNDAMYLVDSYNHRISKYILSSGAYVGSIGEVVTSTGTCPSSGIATGWCTGGVFTNDSIDGAFDSPGPAGLDAGAGFLYIGDQNNYRLVKVNVSTGTVVGAVGVTSGGSTGSCPANGVTNGWCTGGTFVQDDGDGGFDSIVGASADTVQGFIYVSDYGSYKVNKFDLATGIFVGAIGNLASSTGTCPISGAAPGWCTGGSFQVGNGDGMFSTPYGVAFDPEHDLMYVGEADNNSLQKFQRSTGAFIGAKGLIDTASGSGPNPCPGSGIADFWCTGATFQSGSQIGAFNYPQNAFSTPDGYLYVIDNGNYRIVRMD